MSNDLVLWLSFVFGVRFVMSIESLMRAAEAAGFATASDENDRGHGNAQIERPMVARTKSPREVLSFASVQSAFQEPLGFWARTQLTNLLPARHAKL